MTKRKEPTPWIYPDRTVKGDDGVLEHWVLWGLEGPGGLHPIGTFHLPEDRASVIAQRRRKARGNDAKP